MSALAGLLTERVAIARPDPARDAIGSASGQWIAVATISAGLVPEGRNGWRVVLRRPSAIREGWRMTWRDRRLRVTDVTIDPRTPDRLILMAEEMR
ncbi:head-tail adaptor protein [Sphingomonas naphthae]|uniref:Head-tail adaptor protein n=1 Tax=Sphingomonas naphthae TaxID=1813468 RepID=A0ABY7TPA0_9SPHN|nr:head-tail adaptor protein [Sphingomonas naphthae]WCT73674.1 head-tail adaptor protein [Sphingomonas naphthae]